MKRAAETHHEPIISLDLEKDVLYGWEHSVSDLAVDAITRGIAVGDTFPPVPVHRDGDAYWISPLRETHDRLCDGGHTRAVAHLRTQTRLRCVVLSGGPCTPPSFDILIRDIQIVPDSGQYKEKKQRFPNYR